MFHDHEADPVKVRDLDDLIDDALRGKGSSATKRAIRFFKRQVVVRFADVAFLLEIVSDEKLSNQERVEHFDHIAKAGNQGFTRFGLARRRGSSVGMARRFAEGSSGEILRQRPGKPHPVHSRQVALMAA